LNINYINKFYSNSRSCSLSYFIIRNSFSLPLCISKNLLMYTSLCACKMVILVSLNHNKSNSYLKNKDLYTDSVIHYMTLCSTHHINSTYEPCMVKTEYQNIVNMILNWTCLQFTQHFKNKQFGKKIKTDETQIQHN
jgi:hypothetical protein